MKSRPTAVRALRILAAAQRRHAMIHRKAGNAVLAAQCNAAAKDYRVSAKRILLQSAS